MDFEWKPIVEVEGKKYLGGSIEYNGEHHYVTAVGIFKGESVEADSVHADITNSIRYYLVEQRDFEGKKVVKRVLAESKEPFTDLKGMKSVSYIQMRGTRGMMKQTWNLVCLTGEELREHAIIHWDSKENTVLNPPYDYMPHYEDVNEY
ncbi:hypothetical protein P9X10_01155 [Bacillus cereus]|nr:hypothetical protein [Bacillus cereus]